MIQFTRITLLIGLAAATVAAQTLSFGEITLVTPATTPPTYQVNLVLTGGSNTVAGYQYDLNYDPNSLKVTLGTGANTTGYQINTTCLGSQFTGCASVASFNPSTTAAMNNGPGQRAIVIGCCSASQVAGTTQVTSATMADGSVGTITVQALAGATSQVLTLKNPAGTTQGGNNVAAQAVNLTVGAGTNDPGATGTLDLNTIYLVGDVGIPTGYPPASTHAPNFGTPGKLVLNNLILMLFVATNAPGFPPPQSCSDLFDAMDAFPADTATTRGGDGSIKLNDLILILERATNAPGFTVWPARATRGLTCGARTAPTASVARPVGGSHGDIVLGAAQTANGQDRVPVYLEGSRELNRVAVGFSAGDEQSQFRFVAGDAAPSLVQDSQAGFVAAAWLDGLTVRAGQRLLLGYLTGPAGSAQNLKIFGVSAVGLADNSDVNFNIAARR